MPLVRMWDIFCTVVDNYGDIGVSWRLARQLAVEHNLQVRLWVDDLQVFARIWPEIDPALSIQFSRGVEIRHWSPAFSAEIPADVVVEAFGCNLPESYLVAMAAKEPHPVWINLEYLSAEDWIAGCHGLASPHPSLPLVKHFFFPGFGSATGGLLAESGLAETRRAFQHDQAAVTTFWLSLGLLPPEADETVTTLFSYGSRPITSLLAAWASGDTRVFCLVPEGNMRQEVASFFGQREARAGSIFRKGALTVFVFPFLEQDHYDRLLWVSDCNFVRGEDSFVRAQWAARPMVWQIYPQECDAHWPKLQAFLDLYCVGLPRDAAADLRRFWESWNRGKCAGATWQQYWRHRNILEQHAQQWVDHWLGQNDLATNLVHFCEKVLK